MVELIPCPHEASSDYSVYRKVQLSSLKKAIPEGVELSSLKKALPEGVELSSLTKTVIKGDKHLANVNGEKYVVMAEWMKIEPCLPYLVGSEGLGGVATCTV